MDPGDRFRAYGPNDSEKRQKVDLLIPVRQFVMLPEKFNMFNLYLQ
jgi:hypothetical protein